MNYTSPKHIGDYNKHQILSILREKGPTSRVELSEILEISQTAVTRNTSKLLENGIIRECGAEQSAIGRKPVLIGLCGEFCYVLAADIVGNTLKAELADFMGRIVEYHEEPLKHKQGAYAVLQQLIGALRSIIDKAGLPPEKIWVATIGTPGIFDPGTGKSRFSDFLEGWDDIYIRREIFDFIAIETLIENDVNLDVIGESWKGVGADYKNILYVKLGQGLAARFVLQKRLIRGEHNLAGEIGHMFPCLQPANTVNYENLLRNNAVSQRYHDAAGKNTVETLSDLLELANKGDETAAVIMNDSLDHFAQLLLNCVTVLDPQVIILGGDACCFAEKEITYLKQRIEQYFPLPQNIIVSKLGKKACVNGAVKMGLLRIEERITGIWRTN